MIPNISAILFIIVCIIIFFIVAYFLYPRTRTDEQIFENIVIGTNAGDVRGATISQTDDGQYINMYPDGERKKEATPIRLDGTPINDFNQPGEVTYLDNGFTIKGVDVADFTCIDPFIWNTESKRCTIKPLCTDEEGVVKGINQTYFNTLGIYTLKDIPTASRSYAEDEVYHKRVFAICSAGTEHTLHVCPLNKLYDNDSKTCVIYDYCNDRLDGETHRYAITENAEALKENEYYQCQSNISVLKECDDGEVYSDTHKMCISQNPCFGKGNATLPNTDTSYIMCKNDTGIVVQCPGQVFIDGEHIECKNPECDVLNVFRNTIFNDYDIGYKSVRCLPGTNKPVSALCVGATPIKEIYKYTIPPNTNITFDTPSNEFNVFYTTKLSVNAEGKCDIDTRDDIRPDPTELRSFIAIDNYPPLSGLVKKSGEFYIVPPTTADYNSTYRGTIVNKTTTIPIPFCLVPQTFYFEEDIFTKQNDSVDILMGDVDKHLYCIREFSDEPSTTAPNDKYTNQLGYDGDAITVIFRYFQVTINYTNIEEMKQDVINGSKLLVLGNGASISVGLLASEDFNMPAPEVGTKGDKYEDYVFNPVTGLYHNIFSILKKTSATSEAKMYPATKFLSV